MTAHLLFAPLARFIERQADKEEAERQKLVDWLAAELERETSAAGLHAPATGQARGMTSD